EKMVPFSSTCDCGARRDRQDELLVELISEVRALRLLIESQVTPRTPQGDDAAYCRLLCALEVSGGEFFEAPFAVSDVLDAAQSDQQLASALDELGAPTTSGLGAIFRSLRDRSIDGRRLTRDGRHWRLICT